MQEELIDGATAVAAVLATVGAWSNARRIDRLAVRVDGLERTVQMVLMVLSAARRGPSRARRRRRPADD